MNFKLRSFVFVLLLIVYGFASTYFWPITPRDGACLSSWMMFARGLFLTFTSMCFGVTCSAVMKWYDDGVLPFQSPLKITISPPRPITFSKDIPCSISLDEGLPHTSNKGSLIIFAHNGTGVVDLVRCDIQELKETNKAVGTLRRGDLVSVHGERVPND
jgi:hypothetical protein